MIGEDRLLLPGLVSVLDDDERRSEQPEAWIYDGLDRRAARLVALDGQIEARERSYIGTTELLSREADEGEPGPIGIGGGPETKTYDYDSQGMRVGQEVRKESILDPVERYSAYDTDAAGSVIGLEDEQGTFDDPDAPGQDTDNHYDYDPYAPCRTQSPATPSPIPRPSWGRPPRRTPSATRASTTTPGSRATTCRLASTPPTSAAS